MPKRRNKHTKREELPSQDSVEIIEDTKDNSQSDDTAVEESKTVEHYGVVNKIPQIPKDSWAYDSSDDEDQSSSDAKLIENSMYERVSVRRNMNVNENNEIENEQESESIENIELGTLTFSDDGVVTCQQTIPDGMHMNIYFKKEIGGQKKFLKVNNSLKKQYQNIEDNYGAIYFGDGRVVCNRGQTIRIPGFAVMYVKDNPKKNTSRTIDNNVAYATVASRNVSKKVAQRVTVQNTVNNNLVNENEALMRSNNELQNQINSLTKTINELQKNSNNIKESFSDNHEFRRFCMDVSFIIMKNSRKFDYNFQMSLTDNEGDVISRWP